MSNDWCTPTPVLEPQEPPPELQPNKPSALCSLGWRVIFITGLLRDLLIRQFSTPLNVEEPDLRHLVWREDERTRILIESIHRWRGELVEKRPALILKRNAYQNLRWGIADRVGTDERGQEIYCTGWVGSHTVFCIHGSGAGVDILATEVQRMLTQFAPAVVRNLGLLRWAVTEVGEIQEVEEARESFVVPITIGWAYQENWILELESMKLRRLSLSTLLKC